MNWSHAICDECWYERNPHRDPVRIVAEFRDVEKCCYCGKVNESGIYIRSNPADVKYPTP